ncbi:MAG: hypothetical protein AB1351_12655 [Thermoproteota archaeon]
MALKTLPASTRINKEDVDFLHELGLFKNNSDGIRLAVKLMWLYSIPALKAIKSEM